MSNTQVFISYSHNDIVVVEELVRHLENAGLKCWYASRDIAPGADWAGSIVSAIREAPYFVLIFSDSSNASDQVCREVDMACACRTSEVKHTVINFRISNAEVSGPLSYYIDRNQWVDATEDPDRAYITLARKIREGLGMGGVDPSVTNSAEAAANRKKMEGEPATWHRFGFRSSKYMTVAYCMKRKDTHSSFWACSTCGQQNIDGAMFCKACGMRRESDNGHENEMSEGKDIHSSFWICSKCGRRGEGDFCTGCGAPRESDNRHESGTLNLIDVTSEECRQTEEIREGLGMGGVDPSVTSPEKTTRKEELLPISNEREREFGLGAVDKSSARTPHNIFFKKKSLAPDYAQRENHDYWFCTTCGRRMDGGVYCLSCGGKRGCDDRHGERIDDLSSEETSSWESSAGTSFRLKEVEFSAIAPKIILRGTYTLIKVVMYEKAFRYVVDHMIGDSDEPVQESRSGIFRVKENSWIKIVLSSPDIILEDDNETGIWQGDYLNFSFSFFLPEQYERQQILFYASVYVNDLIATRLKFIVACGYSRQKIEVIRDDVLSAFMSYASQDRARVAAVVQGMRKARPDMDIFFDVESLRSGDDWEPVLYHEIEKRDMLFLCWSRFARESEWVDIEWRYALKNKGSEYIDPVPLDPPESCPPPEELKHKHFNDKLLYITGAEKG